MACAGHSGFMEQSITTSSHLLWLKLKCVSRVGPRTVKRLLDVLGGIKDIFEADRSLLESVPGGLRVWHSMGNRTVAAVAEKILLQVQAADYSLCTPDDPCFPDSLREARHVPPVLFVRGSLNGRSRSVAVVGSRYPSSEGARVARNWARDFALAGFTVVSGLAYGIDAAAHRGALEAGGHTVGVLGCGPDKVYPPDHDGLARDIVQAGGAVISEFWPGTEPAPYNFPTRNRTIAGLARAVIVVEAAEKSGALHTAKMARSYGRPVYAVPGPLSRTTSAGTNQLIRAGASVALSSAQVIEELGGVAGERIDVESLSLSPLQRDIWEQLDGAGVHLDLIARKLRMSTPKLLTELLQMELMGVVHQLPGKRFQIGTI